MAEEEQEEGSGGKGKLMLLVAVGLMLVLISIGGTVAVLMIFNDEPEEVVDEESSEMPDESVPQSKSPAVYFPIKPPILLTYSDKGRQRYAQIELTLLARKQSVVKEVELHSSRIRNDLILVFSGFEFHEIQTAEGKELMRQQALSTVQNILNEEMGEPGVEQILFTNLVMQ